MQSMFYDELMALAQQLLNELRTDNVLPNA